MNTQDHSQNTQLGDWNVWTLNDGYLDLDQNIFVGIEPTEVRQQIIEAKVSCVNDLKVRTQVNAYLIDTKKHLILVDAGCGSYFGPTAGFLAKSLHESGHDFNQISHVLITHLHPDHMCGLLTSDGAPAFPEATICVSTIEADYWRDPEQEAIANNISRPCFALAQKILAPYYLRGRLRLIESGEDIVPGITAIEAFGHTPGHIAFLISSRNEQLLLWGDLVHSPGIQFAKPEWYVAFDTDGVQAVLSRKRLFAKAADQQLLVGGHFPNSGLAHVSRNGDVFSWKSL